MKFSELIDHAIVCIKGFNPVIKTLDSHADEFIAQFTDPYEKVFIKQVFYGCTRYQEFLKIFTKVFFEKNLGNTNRNDATLYQIFAYLSFFRLDELSPADYRKLVVSQEATKMHVFMQFAFNADTLRECLREPWMALYDFTYIDEKIIGGVERNLPAVADIIKNVEKRATGKVTTALSVSSRQESTMGGELTESHLSAHEMRQSDVFSDGQGEEQKQPKKTEFKPFNLTKPKPKMIPPPEQIKREIKARPFPKNMNKKTLADIENDKMERRQATINAIRGEYEGNQKKRFSLATEARPTIQKADRVKEVVEEQIVKELKFEGTKPRKMPNFDKYDANVKLNVAALKREKHLIDLEEQEEQEKLEQMAMGLKDASEFNRWKAEMNEKDEIERLEHIQKKKIEMELAREQAIMARENKEQENHQLVNKMRAEMDVMMEEREINIQELISQKKEVIAQVQANKDAAVEQVVLKQKENKAIRDEVHRDLQEALKKRQDEEAAELAKRTELIRQIRELEKIPIQRTKGFDPTEAGGHGLMEEMSIAELRERLEFNKRQLQQEVEFKRETNLTRKEQEAAQLMEEAKKIEEARNRRKAQNDARRLKKQNDAEALAAKTQAAREKGLLEVHGKIEQKKKEKREEEARLAQELKEIRLQRQYLNANAAMVEEQAWKQLEAGKERQIRNNQNDRLIDQCGVNEIHVKDQGVRAENAKTSVLNKLEYDQGYTNRLNTRKRENEVLHKNTLEYKASQHEKQQAAESNLREAQKKRNPFVAKVNEQSLAKATAFRHKQTQKQRLAAIGTASLEFAALQQEEEMDGGDEHQQEFGGEMDVTGNSALDMLGEAEQAVDDIEAKMDLE